MAVQEYQHITGGGLRSLDLGLYQTNPFRQVDDTRLGDILHLPIKSVVSGGAPENFTGLVMPITTNTPAGTQAAGNQGLAERNAICGVVIGWVAGPATMSRLFRDA